MISGAVAVIGVTAVLVGIPLALTSISIAEDTSAQADAHEAGQEWADRVGWTLIEVDMEAGELVVRFEGPIPVPTTDDLVRILREHGVDPGDVHVELLPRTRVDLEGPSGAPRVESDDVIGARLRLGGDRPACSAPGVRQGGTHVPLAAGC